MNDTNEVLAELKAIRQLLAAERQPQPALLERKALAALLSVGLTTLDTMRACGKVGPVEVIVGGGIRWHADEVAAWLRHRAPTGELYDSRAWPAVWKTLTKRS